MKSCRVLLCSKSLLAAFGISRSFVNITSPVIRRLYVGLPKKGSRYRRSEMENPNFFSSNPRSLMSFMVSLASLTHTQAKPNSWLLDPFISKNSGACRPLFLNRSSVYGRNCVPCWHPNLQLQGDHPVISLEKSLFNCLPVSKVRIKWERYDITKVINYLIPIVHLPISIG